MTQKLSYELDWLSFTDPGLYAISDMGFGSWATPNADIAVPRAGYNRALKLEAGRVDWHTDRISQKRLWTLTGSDLEKLTELHFDQADLVKEVSRILGVTVTRLDFAADIKGAGAKPQDIEDAWMRGEVKTQARRMRPVEEFNKRGEPQGKTVYIGSRTSAAYLRVYDKGAEQDEYTDWCRVEVETKAPLAGVALQNMAELGVGPAGCALTCQFVNLPLLEWWTDLFSGAGEADFTIGRKVTDWEKWVKAVALPNVIEAAKQDVSGVRAALEAALLSFDKTCTDIVH